MDLSARLKQARLDAGLSQKALCGDRITRNMLSQIENGSARPSMDTLRYLAQQLGKPLSYFLEEEAVTSPNQALMEKVRTATPSDALVLLGSYKAPDPTFDPERWLVEALVCMALAEEAIAQGKSGYAKIHFEKAWDLDPAFCCARLEDCCRETEDFAGAYFYACKMREQNR